MGVVDEKWKPNLATVVPAAFIGCAIAGRTALALSSVERITFKQKRPTQAIPMPVAPVPTPTWGAGDQMPTYEAETEYVPFEPEELEQEDQGYAEEEAVDDYRYEAEDPWAVKRESVVR